MFFGGSEQKKKVTKMQAVESRHKYCEYFYAICCIYIYRTCTWSKFYIAMCFFCNVCDINFHLHEVSATAVVARQIQTVIAICKTICNIHTYVYNVQIYIYVWIYINLNTYLTLFNYKIKS